MKVAVIGGGAAGVFAAVNIKEKAPDIQVDIFEGGERPLSKVYLTGGGRCNLTNSFEGVDSLSKVYPRGDSFLKGAFKVFNHEDVCRWFESRGVRLVVQSDNCVFPQSQSAAEVVNALLGECDRLGVQIHCGRRVSSIEKTPDGTFSISFASGDESINADAVLVTTGGSPLPSGMDFLRKLPLEFVPPVPSLYGFRIDDNVIKKMMGIVAPEAVVSLQGTKLKASGPLLVTHWGMTGPAILKLSSYAARELHQSGYKGRLTVNWTGLSEQETTESLKAAAASSPSKLISSTPVEGVASVLWTYLLEKAGIPSERKWGELGSKGLNRLTARMITDEYDIIGKNRHAEEFVTCGGVSLDSISRKTMECKTCEGLYFAGEVTDVDAVTGGFNLQAAWTMGYVAAESVVKKFLTQL